MLDREPPSAPVGLGLAYLGPAGWLGLRLPTAGASQQHWVEVAELLDASHRTTTGRRLVAQLDAQTGAGQAANSSGA